MRIHLGLTALLTLRKHTLSFLFLIPASAMEDFQYASQSLEPDLRTLHVIQVASQILQLVQIHFQNCVMPLLSTSPPAHRETVMYKNQFMEVMENKIADLLQKQLDVVGHWIGSILNKQKRTDFKPKDDAAGINITATSVRGFKIIWSLDNLKKTYTH